MDPSLRAFGWGILLINTKITLKTGGVFKTKPVKGLKSQSDIENILAIVSFIKALIKTHKIKIAHFEIPFGSKSSRAAQALSLVEGAVLATLVTQGTEIHPWLPQEIKQSLTGNPYAEKEDVLTQVRQQIQDFDKITAGFSQDDTLAVSDACGAFLVSLNPPTRKIVKKVRRRAVGKRLKKTGNKARSRKPIS